MDEDQFSKFVVGSRWQFAHSMPYVPHCYTKRIWSAENGEEKLFEDAVMFIRENGVKEGYGKREFVYYYLDDKKYWTMGSPLDETILINRAFIKSKKERDKEKTEREAAAETETLT